MQAQLKGLQQLKEIVGKPARARRAPTTMTAVETPVRPSAFASARARARDASRNVVLIGFQKPGQSRPRLPGGDARGARLPRRGHRLRVPARRSARDDPAPRPRRRRLLADLPVLRPPVTRDAGPAAARRRRRLPLHDGRPLSEPEPRTRRSSSIPELDSVVRFEGELTLLELVRPIGTGRGLARRPGDRLPATRRAGVTTGRPLLRDLDDLPLARPRVRARGRPRTQGHAALASRGCARTCSFCSIHMFYRTAPGKVVRTRNPAEVVDEMRLLHDERGHHDLPVPGRRLPAVRAGVAPLGAGASRRDPRAGPRRASDLEDQLPRRRRRPGAARRDARRRPLPRLHGPRVGQRDRASRRCTSRSRVEQNIARRRRR